MQRAGAALPCGAQASHCGGLSYCGARALELHGMWNLLEPGIEPVFPALQGRFLTTGPPEKPMNELRKHHAK